MKVGLGGIFHKTDIQGHHIHPKNTCEVAS
jgi:hypothetical protein